MSQSWPCTTILQKRAWQGQRSGLTHVPLNSPHTLSPSLTLHASRHQRKSATATRKSHFPPNGQVPVHSLRNQNAMHCAMSMQSQSSGHTTNFQKRKKAQKMSALRSPIRKSNEDETEFIDSGDKGVSGSDYVLLRQTHIRVSPLHTISSCLEFVFSAVDC
jgi:hypothetical protein